MPSWRSGSLTVITSFRLIDNVGVDVRSDRLEPDGPTLVGRVVPIGGLGGSVSPGARRPVGAVRPAMNAVAADRGRNTPLPSRRPFPASTPADRPPRARPA